MYIMAEALTEKVMKIGGFDSYEIVETHPGRFFENMLAQHPFLDKTSRLCFRPGGGLNATARRTRGNP